ncbi:hypothetical protein YN1551_2010 [Sulfolobus islandicus Y.N.15.51]|jgi:hypothetical protein|uniref:Uncharacterized protein n=1 Tax=Saccharolobus islandicus (strain Y.N.15.51 / Yellowstone \|nr:hypothetical protein YN1551_2010 [Sulfolobus islandicus Y.N.15.51]
MEKILIILKISLLSIISILFIILFSFIYNFYLSLSYSSFSILMITSILLQFTTLISILYAIIIAIYVYRHLEGIIHGSIFTILPLINGIKPLAWFIIIEGILLIVIGVFTKNLIPSIILLIGGAVVLLILRYLRKRSTFKLRRPDFMSH